MPEENASAEKDLLKIIEDPDKAGAGSALPAKSLGRSRGKAKGSLQGILGAGRSVDPKSLFQLPVINRILIVAAVAVFCNFVVTFFIESSRPGKADKFIESITTESEIPHEVSEDLAEMEALVQADPVMARNLFGMQPIETPEDEAKPAYVDMLANYRLVGISLEPTPENSYAMIENTGSQVTYFLKQGDEFGGMTIVGIEKDKVLVDVEGNVTEFR